jgi:L-seryl-tRNA(Ser) seleniumtransferase
VDGLRSEIKKADDATDVDVSLEAVSARVVEAAKRKFAPSIRHAINATGIVLHTGLGRAVLSKQAVDAILDVATGYCNLATDLESGQRGSRHVHFTSLLCELTGAEDATVVNNNAAATMLVLNTLAAGKEVIVSRGQLVEIGGSFRMPDVMASSGAILREVGTTNKTHLRDYANAINENTGAILRVHMSNYRIVGFFEEPGIVELTDLAHKHDLPVIDDLGSGALVELSDYGVESEPMIRDSIRAGVDAACFSGDKLIGGPQCGIVVGKKTAIEAMKKNPLARALRIGKLETAALEATLRLFLEPGRINENHPTYRMLSMKPDQIGRRARAMAKKLGGIAAEVTVIDGSSQVGSGSVPAEMLPTKLVSVRPRKMSADCLARRLRYSDTPVFARIHQEAVLFDPRTIQPGEEATVVGALREMLAG